VLEFSVLFVLPRNWVQATFTLNSASPQGPNGQHDLLACEGEEDKLATDTSKKSSGEEIDLSEDFCNMFGTSHSLDEVQ
jgi:methyltransferase-like protein 6